MGAHLQQGRMWLGQSRYDRALEEFQQEIAENVDCPTSHALAAVCLLEKKDTSRALSMAERAIGLGPDQDLPYYAMAKVQYALHDYGRALGYIEEAIRIDPNDPDWRALRSAYLYDTRRWPESLSSAEEGLRLNPMHVGCQNMRGLALVKLGRRAEAQKTLQSTLQQSPESSSTHAAMGWSRLESGDPTAALEHFGEALRISPGSNYARSGLVAALKARNPVYRWMLAYFMWSSRHSRFTRIVVIAGVYFTLLTLDGVGAQSSALAKYAHPLWAFMLLFFLMTWLADPLFNLLLLFHRVGRHALSDDQRRTAKSVGFLLGLASVILLLGALRGSEMGYCMAAAVGFLVLPYSAIRRVHRGWKRTILSTLVGALTIAVLILLVGAFLPSTDAERTAVEQAALGLSLAGSVLTLLATNLLRMASRSNP